MLYRNRGNPCLDSALMGRKASRLAISLACLAGAIPFATLGDERAGWQYTDRLGVVESVGFQLALPTLRPTWSVARAVGSDDEKLRSRLIQPRVAPGWRVRLAAARATRGVDDGFAALVTPSRGPRPVVFRTPAVREHEEWATWVAGGVYFGSAREMEFGIAFANGGGRVEGRWQALFSVVATF